jgi:single-strand DNA-binding protein
MALELNRVQMAGRLTKEPEIRTLPNGTTIATISIAVGREYTAQGQARQSDFFNAKAFKGTADFLQKYFHKGMAIYVEGSLQTNNWTDKNGQKRYSTDIMIDKVKFVESANRGGNKNTSTGDIPSETTGAMPNFETLDTTVDLPF